MASTWAASEPASSTLDAPNAWSPSGSSHGDATASRGREPQVGGVHPELARPVVADEPDALQPRRLGDGRAEQDGLAAPEPLGDPREPPQLADRLDGHDPHARLDRGVQLLVALAGAREHDPVRGEARPEGVAQLAARGHVGAQAGPGQVRAGPTRLGLAFTA